MGRANFRRKFRRRDPVLLGSDTITATDAAWVVPNYTTLVIELWGGGGGAPGVFNNAGTLYIVNGSPFGTMATDGGDTTIASLSLVAGGGDRSHSGRCGITLTGSLGSGGVATGGDVNTPGAQGTLAVYNPGVSLQGGNGGGSPNGGATAVGPNDTSTGSPGLTATPGNIPGGGASGGANLETLHNARSVAADGASGGAYCKKTYNVGDPGAPVPGATLNIVIGAGGLGSISGAATRAEGAVGARGEAYIEWY